MYKDSQEFVKQLEGSSITHITFMNDYLAIGFNIGEDRGITIISLV